MPDSPAPDSVPALQARLAETARELARAQEAHRQSEARQRESHDHFAKSFHASPALMTMTRLKDGILLEANEAFLRTAGYARDEVIGHRSLDLNIWVNPADRTSLLTKLLAEGRVRDHAAVFRTKSGDIRHVIVNADLFEMDGSPCALITSTDNTERHRREQVQEATYQISRVLLAEGGLDTLFAEVHRIIGGLMPARNFYVALLNHDDGLIHFPYFVDEIISAEPPRKPGNGLTEHVLRTGQPLLATPAELAALLRANGDYVPQTHPPAIRLAAPLLIDGKAIGTIAVQDYHDAKAYGEEEKRLLLFVADQAAAAVHRRLSETSRRESQEYFAKSFQTTPALMIIARLSDGHILEANSGFEQASGFTRTEALGRSTMDLGLWVDTEHRDKFIGDLRRDGRVRDFEGIFRTKTGIIRHLLLNADVFEMRGTKCMLTVGVDISERRRREQVQEATYQISRAVLGGGDLAALFAEMHRIIGGLMPARNFYVALLSADGTALSFPYFVDETSPAPATVRPGHGLTEYVLVTARPLLSTADGLTVLEHGGQRFAPVGQSAALWLGAPLIMDGRAIGVIAVQDYHNAKAYGEEEKRLLLFVADQAAAAVHRGQAAEAVQRAERQYRGIFENALEGLYQSSPAGQFLHVNRALIRMCGYATPADFITAMNDISRQFYVDPARRQEFLKLIESCDEVTDFDSEIFRADGSKIWISESVRAVRNAAGEISRFEGVAIDITAQRETARALQSAKETADAANRAKSQFLASMSHELRTPLNGILGYTQILRRDPVLGEKQRAGLGIIHQSAEHLLALINDVLDLARIEARKLELHPAEVDLPEFARTVEGFFMPRAREKGLRLATEFATDLPLIVRADAQRLRQVVYNLLSNAVKFTKSGGVVFSVERAGDMIRFSVSDTGPGIAPSDQARLFEPFLQIGDHGARAEGTGLGLNVSRGIVEQMGGRLLVESRLGWGSRFWFEVPLPAVTGATTPATPVTPRHFTGYAGPRQRVLAVDDHAANRSMLVDLLEPLGFEVTTADDGIDAVRLAREWQPHLVLMDLRMPRLDGFGAARQIREQLPSDGPVIIGISASAFDPDRQACLDAGCSEFLAKPFREEQLFAAIERQLGLTWQYAEVPTAGETSMPFPAMEHAPSATDAEALFELATKGDVMGVRAYAQQLAAQDPRLAPFAQGVTELAARFKMKAIRQFVARYRTAIPSPEN